MKVLVQKKQDEDVRLKPYADFRFVIINFMLILSVLKLFRNDL